MLRQFSRFAVIGAFATAVQYALLIALVQGADVAPTPASAAGFLVSAVFNYLCNYHYTFRSRQPHAIAAVRFAILGGIGLAMNSLIVHTLVGAHLHYLLAQVAATAVVLLWNFGGNRLWTFRGAPAELNAPGTQGMRSFVERNFDLLLVLAFTAAIRLAVCMLTDDQSGDADQRAILSAQWAAAPVWIQIGSWLPLHFYATGVLTWLFGNPITAGKTLSFVTGTLSVLPLFYMTERLFDRTVAVVAGLLFAVYGMHVGLSSVVMSEAPFALFATCGVTVLLRETSGAVPRARRIYAAAGLLAVAAGFRQEAWQLAGILSLYLLWQPATRRYAVPFALIAFSTLAVYAVSNGMADRGWLRPLYAVNHAKTKESLYHHFSAAENLLRWAYIFAQSPGPIITALGAFGAFLAFKRRTARKLALIAASLIAPFVLLSIVKPQWQPQARYPLFFVILMLPYAAYALAAAGRRVDLRAATVVVLLLSTLTQGAAFHRRSHRFLPVPDYDANDVSAWNWLALNGPPDSTLVVEDTEWRSPGIIVHSGWAARGNHEIAGYEPPEVLEDIVAHERGRVLLVAHSAPAKWPFLQHLDAKILFANPDYQIFSVNRTAR